MSNDNSPINLDGLTVPIVTPLTKNRKIDKAGIEKLVNFQLDNGVDKIFVAGTTGEFASLPRNERREGLRLVLEATNNRVPVYYGVSHSSSAVAVKEAKATEGLGIDAFVSTPPFYYDYSQEEIFRHFKAITEAVDLPVIIYDIPSKTQNMVELSTLKNLSQEENVVGLKDTTGDMNRFQILVKEFEGRSDFSIAQGTEEYFYHSLLSGAEGLVSGMANLWPSKIREQIDMVEAGNYEEARKIQFELFDVFRVYDQASFLAGIKTGLSLKGICSAHLSEPFRPPTEEEEKNIERILLESGIL